jgi:hypothetical protein
MQNKVLNIIFVDENQLTHACIGMSSGGDVWIVIPVIMRDFLEVIDRRL